MEKRVRKLMRFGAALRTDNGLQFASGNTVPSSGTAGYRTGCIFQHDDGGAGTALYINEGSVTSCSFAAVAALTAAQEALLSATAGTVAASKALIPDASKNLSTLGILGLAGLSLTQEAVVATSDGLTTGTIADGGLLRYIAVTSAGANNIVVLPTPTPGTTIIGYVGSNGFELRSSTPASVGISGGTGASAESAIPADTLFMVVCVSATSWLGWDLTGTTFAAIEAAA